MSIVKDEDGTPIVFVGNFGFAPNCGFETFAVLSESNTNKTWMLCLPLIGFFINQDKDYDSTGKTYVEIEADTTPTNKYLFRLWVKSDEALRCNPS